MHPPLLPLGPPLKLPELTYAQLLYHESKGAAYRACVCASFLQSPIQIQLRIIIEML